MGKNKRSSKVQGIRKKKASKQTLVKVAEKREKKHEKIQAAIAARNGVRNDSFVRIASTNKIVPQHDERGGISPFREDEDLNPRERVIARRVKNCRTIYKRLLVSLKENAKQENVKANRRIQPLFDNERKILRSDEENHLETKISSQNEGSVRRGEDCTEKIVVENIKLSSERLSAENYAAAIRESQHFGSDVVPQKIEQKMKVVGTFDGLGRVSASLPNDRFEVLRQLFSTGCEEIDDVMLGMRPSLFKRWRAMVETELSMKAMKLPKIHRTLIAFLREYRDIFISGQYSRRDEDFLRKLYTVHCLSHVLRCRNRIVRNDNKLRDPAQGGEPEKDQGFSRARVLMLLPMKNVAYDVVKTLQALAVGVDEAEENVSQIANKDRFESEFAPDPSEEDEDVGSAERDENFMTEKKRRKPEDYRRTFRGNIDDDFKLGIAFTNKSMKLYNDFYSSDIIVASPLGLRRLLAEKASGKDFKSELEKQRREEAVEWKSKIGTDISKPKVEVANSDFLSSIEICIVDGLHVFSMQNWETLRQALSMVNNMPSSTRDTDFSRVRDWCLEGLMPHFRQTILLSQYRKSEFLSLFRELSNHDGKIQVIQTAREHGTMTDVLVSARQTFFKLRDVESPLQALDTRFNFFFDNVLPQLRSLLNCRSLVVIPTYFDYVRVRNRLIALAKDDMSIRFTSMCEYSKPNEVSRARSRFFDGSVSMVLITERFHFYWRYWIRGANTLVWYALPENSIFYPELLNMTAEAAESGQAVHSIALYDTYDSFCLERIVGTSRCKRMRSKQSRSIYLFR